MAEPDDTRLESAASARSSVFAVSSSAWHGEHSFRSESLPNDDYDELVKAAMQKAAEHPDAHRMAVMPTENKSKITTLDVNKLTQSKKKLLVTRALSSSGQDNEKLLQKIRARQDRYVLDGRAGSTQAVAPGTLRYARQASHLHCT